MEFAPLGSLDHVLSKADENGVDISNLVKIIIGMQVAEAMTHLISTRWFTAILQRETFWFFDLIPKIGSWCWSR